MLPSDVLEKTTNLIVIPVFATLFVLFTCVGKKKRKEKVSKPSKEVKDGPATTQSPDTVKKSDDVAKEKTKSVEQERNPSLKTKPSDNQTTKEGTEGEKSTKVSETEKKTEDEKKKQDGTANKDEDSKKKDEPKNGRNPEEKPAVISDPIVTPETDEYPTLEDEDEKSKNKVKTAKGIESTKHDMKSSERVLFRDLSPQIVKLCPVVTLIRSILWYFVLEPLNPLTSHFFRNSDNLREFLVSCGGGVDETGNEDDFSIAMDILEECSFKVASLTRDFGGFASGVLALELELCPFSFIAL